MAVDLAEVAYEASLRRLDKQEHLLDELRARTGLLLAVASLAVSFLGRPAADADPLALAVLALAAFAVSVGASVYVLMPKKQLVFALVGSRLYEQLYAFKTDPHELHRRLTYDLDRFWEENDRILQRVLRAIRVAAWALAVEIASLLAALTGTLG